VSAFAINTAAVLLPMIMCQSVSTSRHFGLWGNRAASGVVSLVGIIWISSRGRRSLAALPHVRFTAVNVLRLHHQSVDIDVMLVAKPDKPNKLRDVAWSSIGPVVMLSVALVMADFLVLLEAKGRRFAPPAASNSSRHLLRFDRGQATDLTSRHSVSESDLMWLIWARTAPINLQNPTPNNFQNDTFEDPHTFEDPPGLSKSLIIRAPLGVEEFGLGVHFPFYVSNLIRGHQVPAGHALPKAVDLAPGAILHVSMGPVHSLPFLPEHREHTQARTVPSVGVVISSCIGSLPPALRAKAATGESGC
jgi:hypothetical protein